MLPRVEMVKQKGLKSQSASLRARFESSSRKCLRCDSKCPDGKEPRLRRTPITKSKAENRTLPQLKKTGIFKGGSQLCLGVMLSGTLVSSLFASRSGWCCPCTIFASHVEFFCTFVWVITSFLWLPIIWLSPFLLFFVPNLKAEGGSERVGATKMPQALWIHTFLGGLGCFHPGHWNQCEMEKLIETITETCCSFLRCSENVIQMFKDMKWDMINDKCTYMFLVKFIDESYEISTSTDIFPYISLLKISQIALRGSAAERRPRRACNEIVSPHSPARRCALRRDLHPTAPTSGFGLLFSWRWGRFSVVLGCLCFCCRLFLENFYLLLLIVLCFFVACSLCFFVASIVVLVVVLIWFLSFPAFFWVKKSRAVTCQCELQNTIRLQEHHSAASVKTW